MVQPNLYKQKEEILKPERKGYVIDYATGRQLRERPEEESRQIFEKKLIDEYGYSKDQLEIEFLIQKGSRKIGPADIVVFRDNRKTFDNIYIIVETKRKEITEGIDQLKSYLSPTSAEFGVWFNGKDIPVYLQNLKKAPYFRPIPDIPKKGETLEDVGLYQKKDLIPATELKSVFEVCHNYIYANEGLLKEKTFNEVLKLIFIKMADEKKSNPKCEFRITDKELKELEEGKENGFMNRILDLFNDVKIRYSDVFESNERINLRPLTIAFIVSQFQKYSLINTEADVKGTAFQTFVYAHQRGERGEFFTPHPIVELAVKMLNPKDNEKFIDPACGSGGFLVKGMNYIKEKFIRDNPHRKDVANDFLKDYAHAYISGIDINPDLAKVAKMHMILYDDGHTGIFAANSLDDFDNMVRIAQTMGVPRAIQPQPNTFQMLMTNPPFGTKGKVTNKRILENFDLGHKWRKDKETEKWTKTSKLLDGQVPDILFIERCLQLLDNHGRMAIVLPDGDLTNQNTEYIREFIKQKARLLAVVSLPPETFIPHGTGVKASVLFLQKLSEEELEELKKEDYPIFMAICEKIGHDVRGRTLYKKDEKGELIGDKNGEKIVDSDTPEIIEGFDDFKRKENLGF
jgi:type I restriction enzyme M protein